MELLKYVRSAFWLLPWSVNGLNIIDTSVINIILEIYHFVIGVVIFLNLDFHWDRILKNIFRVTDFKIIKNKYKLVSI